MVGDGAALDADWLSAGVAVATPHGLSPKPRPRFRGTGCSLQPMGGLPSVATLHRARACSADAGWCVRSVAAVNNKSASELSKDEYVLV